MELKIRKNSELLGSYIDEEILLKQEEIENKFFGIDVCHISIVLKKGIKLVEVKNLSEIEAEMVEKLTFDLTEELTIQEEIDRYKDEQKMLQDSINFYQKKIDELSLVNQKNNS